jgi:hypothetical protein
LNPRQKDWKKSCKPAKAGARKRVGEVMRAT